MQFWPVVLLAGIIAVLFAAWLARDVLSQDRGTKAMQEVAGLIFEGAMAFLKRQYRTISVFAIVVVGGNTAPWGPKPCSGKTCSSVWAWPRCKYGAL